MKILLNTSYEFMKHVKKFTVISILLLSVTLAFLTTKGLNYGIDFSGGLLVEVQVKDGVTISDLREKLSTIKDMEATLQKFGSDKDILIRTNVSGLDVQEVLSLVKSTISDSVSTFRRTEYVGPVVGEELKETAIYAVLYALFAMLIYIWLRFEWQFGVAALIALLHDVLITIGFIAIIGVDFGLSTVAAILTIAGYSINDTVVVFDRVRENFIKYNKKDLSEILDKSINQSLSRTVVTSATTLLALLALYIFGGEVIAGFTLAMIFGVLIGTYSSNCLAVPLLMWMKPNRGDEEFIDPVKVLQRQQDLERSNGK